jgi:hypothetical protein
VMNLGEGGCYSRCGGGSKVPVHGTVIVARYRHGTSPTSNGPTQTKQEASH